MNRILFLFLIFINTVSYACHNCTIDNVSYVYNGNNTTTFTIDLTVDVGSLDGKSYGFALIFENTIGVPPVVLSSPAYTPFLTHSTWNNLTAYTGTAIGTGLGTDPANFFDDRYGNRTDVLTYETDDDWFGFGSVDYSRQVEVTLSGCVESIILDGDFRSSLSATAAGEAACTVTYNTGIACASTCDCSSPDCSADLTADPSSPTFNSCESWTGDETNSTVTSYHTITSSPDGTLGILQQLQPTSCALTDADMQSALTNRTATLYALSDCDGTPIAPSTPNAGNSSTLNPEWAGLSPNTQYIIKLEVDLLSCDISGSCLDYYYPPLAVSGCGTCSSPSCLIAGPYNDYNDALTFSNHCSQMNDLSSNPITASSYTSYHAITSSSTGTIGMVISVQEGGPTNPCGVTKIAKLYPLGTNCSSASAISATTTTANGATLYNPEWTGLSPNTSYVLEIVFTIPSGCALIDHCESFYYPSSPPSTTCGSCSNANCPITHVPTFADRFNGYYPNGNCNSMGNISNTTYITYHTITAGSVGEIGLVQQLNISPQGCETRSAVLRPIANSCSSASDIYPSINNANNVGSGFNPEWYGLTPGAQYIVILTTNLGVGCQMDRACLVSYEIPSAPPPPVYNCGTVEFNVTDANDLPLSGPFVYDCSDDTVFLAAVDPPNYFIADQWVYPGFIVTVTPNSGTWDGVNSVEVLINGIVVATLDPASLGLGVNDPFIIPITYAQPEDFSFGVIGNNGQTFDYEIIQASDGTLVSTGTWTIGAFSQINAGIPTAIGTFSGPGVTNDPNNGGKGFFDPGIAGTGTHTITYTYDNGAGCSGSYTIDITVNGPDASISSAGPFCETSDSIPLSSLVIGDVGGTWTINDSAATYFNPDSLGAGNHVIEYTVLSGGCSDIQNQIINVISSPTTSNENITICYGDSIIINGISYNASNLTDTLYLQTSNGCDSILIITVNELGAVNDSIIDITVCENDFFVFNGTTYDASNPTGTHVFQTADGCDSSVTINLLEKNTDTSFIDTVLFTGQSINIGNQVIDSDYEDFINLKDIYGCDSVIGVKVNIIYEYFHFVPTGFSPNNDGENDVIGVMGTGVSEINFYIYNRWGQKVFSYEGDYNCPQDQRDLEGANPLYSWNGTFNNQAVNVETYVYFLKGTYVNGKEFFEKGTISLIK